MIRARRFSEKEGALVFLPVLDNFEDEADAALWLTSLESSEALAQTTFKFDDVIW